MRRPIRSQILLPFSAALLAAAGLVAVTSAWLAVSRTEQQTLSRIQAVVDTLASSSLTYIAPVLQKMHGLSGAHFIAINRSGRSVASTLPDPDRLVPLAANVPLAGPGRSLAELPLIEAASGHRFFATTIRADGAADVMTLLVLYPESSWREARRAAVWPPLAVGAVTAAAMAVISTWLASRLGARIRSVQILLAEIADGRFPEIDPRSDPRPEPRPEPLDELDDLVHSATRLTSQLQDLQRKNREAERMTLLGQMAGGLAHQLRNAVTGAKMAVQLHQRRCVATAGDESLTVALRQLALTEQQMKGMLALSRREVAPSLPGPLGELLADVEQLVRPQCEHAHVELNVTCPADSDAILSDADAFRTMLLNLVLNAIEATGPNGRVTVTAASDHAGLSVSVADIGPGPPNAIRDTLFEPFVTGRAEGVGLGLALCRQSARALGGTLDWTRREDWTVFEFRLPADQPETQAETTSTS